MVAMNDHSILLILGCRFVAGWLRRCAHRSRHIAPDCSGLNFYDIDRSLRDLLSLYMDAPLLAHLTAPRRRSWPAGG